MASFAVARDLMRLARSMTAVIPFRPCRHHFGITTFGVTAIDPPMLPTGTD